MQIKPEELQIRTVSEKGNMGVYEFEPLAKGFGNTLGNTLRRVLLTSLKGAAITQIKIAGVDHQFSTISGVKEDVVELSLNFKKVRVKSYSNDPIVVSIDKKGPGEIKAGDITGTSEVEILNPDLHIATLADKNAIFKAELVVEMGVGYSPMEERQTSKIGVIILDALFSPVVKASYSVTPTRSGKVIDLDKLILTVETDESISPKQAVIDCAKLLKQFFEEISNWTNKAEVAVEGAIKTEKPLVTENISVDELPLPTRTINALKKQGIETLSQLADKSNEELADIKNLGEKSVSEIKKLLKKEGFRQ